MEHLVQEIMESKLEHSFCINNFYEMRLSTIYSWVVYTSRILLAVKFHVFGLTIRKLLLLCNLGLQLLSKKFPLATWFIASPK
jgi:hypothetical protein